MSQNVQEDHSDLIRRLRKLSESPQRDAQKAVKTRAAFLEQANQLAHKKKKDIPVSAALPMRLKDSTLQNKRPFWQRNLFRRKEVSPMWTFLTTMLVTLALAIGGTGITAYAAQDSLPNQPLYAVKTLTEDMQLRLTTQTENQLNLTLQFTNRRINEFSEMAKRGDSVPESVANRYGSEIDHAFQLMAGLPKGDLTSVLQQVKTQLQQQEQTMAESCQGHPEDAVLQQIQTRLQQRLQLTENGLKDPQGFQEQVRQQIQAQIQQQNQNQTQQQNQNQTQQQNQNQTQQQNQNQTQQQNQNQTQQQNQNQTQQQNQNQTQQQNQNQTQQQTSSGSGSEQSQPTPIPNIPTVQPGFGTGNNNTGPGGNSGSGSGSGSGSDSGSGSGGGAGTGGDSGSGTGGGSATGSGSGSGNGSSNGSGNGQH
jgi:hypothetical protein